MYVHLDHLVHSPTSFIHEVMECHCGAPLFRLAASSHDAGIIWCLNRRLSEKGFLSMCTIALEGNSLWLERHQEVDNRVIIDY